MVLFIGNMSSVPCFSLPLPAPRPAHQILSGGSRTDNAAKRRKRGAQTHQEEEQESAAPKQHRVSWHDDGGARSPHAPDSASSASGSVVSPTPGHGDRSSRNSAAKTQDPSKRRDGDGNGHHDIDDEHEGEKKKTRKKNKKRRTKMKEEKHRAGPKRATSKQHAKTVQTHLSSLCPPLFVPTPLVPVPQRQPRRRRRHVDALPHSRISNPIANRAPSFRQQHLAGADDDNVPKRAGRGLLPRGASVGDAAAFQRAICEDRHPRGRTMGDRCRSATSRGSDRDDS